MSSITDAVAAGAYDTKLPYGSGVPSRLRKQGLVSEALALEVQRQAYYADKRRLEIKFRDDLAAEHGVSKNPRAEKLFEIAWDLGHAAGLHEVITYYEKLVELIK